MKHKEETHVQSPSYQQRANFWIDYLEGDLEPSLQEDVDLLLEHSNHDREMLNGLKSIKENIQLADDAELPQDGNYYHRFHQRVMDSIAQEEKPSVKKKAFRFSRLPSFFLVLAIVALGVSTLTSVMQRDAAVPIAKEISVEEQVQDKLKMKASLDERESAVDGVEP